MQHLMSRDLSNFRPWASQQQFLGDKALVDQKLLSLTPPLAWLLEVVESLSNTPAAQRRMDNWHQGLPSGADWPTTLRRSLALQYFREWVAVAKPHGANSYTGSEQRFWNEITKVIPHRFTAVKDTKGDRCVAISLDELPVRVQAYRRGEPND